MIARTVHGIRSALLLCLLTFSLGCHKAAKAPERELGESKVNPPARQGDKNDTAFGDSSRFADVASRTLPAVVSVASTRAVSVESGEGPFGLPFPFFGPPGSQPFPFPFGEGPREQRGLGSGVLEVVSDFDTNTYRAVYAVRFRDAVYVLHACQNKSKRGIATPKVEIDLVKRRLKAAEQHYGATYGKGSKR